MSTPAKVKKLFLTKQRRDDLIWEQLAEHYNTCVAVCCEELGKVDIDTHAYLQEVQKELRERLDNPMYWEDRKVN